MTKFSLLGVLLPLTYGQLTEHLVYPTFIESFSMSWTNPDLSGSTSSSTFMYGTSQEYLTDGDLTSGDRLVNPYTSGEQWGTTSGTPTGMVGIFTANTLATPSGYSYWDISTASISFYGTCFDADSTAEFTYHDYYSSATKTVTVTTTHDATSRVTTFTADIDSSGTVLTAGWVAFDVSANYACEDFVTLTEYKLMGEATATPAPTTAEPTESPTPAPTNQPTMAPTKECKGEVTWGDPHYTLLAMSENTKQFNYQGLGWHYYSFPCDWDDYENWPYFYLSYHKQCNGAKSCINNNRLVLNTKPNPWVIDFYDRDGITALTVGSDVSLTASDFNLDDYTKSNLKNRDETNPVIINYDDGLGQYGQLQIYYRDRSRIVLVLYDVGTSLIAGSRTDCTGSACEECSGRLVKLSNEGSWTWHSCPDCLRNIQCGLMGKYTRGDCTKSQLQDTSHECSQILVKSDDGTNRAVSPAYGDTNFGIFAATWKKTYVDNIITNVKGLSVVSTHNEKERLFTARAAKTQDFDGPKLDGRGIPINWDSSLLDGNCLNNPTEISRINETCRLNTMVKYEKCCNEIGFCSLLWNACIEDMCSCTRPDAPANATETWCLNTWVHGPMNATCSVDEFYPTASPTPAPTPSPVFTINGLIPGKSSNPLLVPMLIFAAVIVILLIGACVWYAKKRNKGVAYFKEDEEHEIDPVATGTTV